MRKLLLFFLCGLFAFMEPDAVVAATAASTTLSTTDVFAKPRVPGPSYKRYKGNSRRKRGPIAAIGRWGARRRTKRNLKMAYKAKPRRGVITVDKPTRNK